MHLHIRDFSGFLPVIHFAGIAIPVYFLFCSLAFIVGLLYLLKRGEARGFSRNRILDVSLVIMITGFVGSRLFHVFFEEPAYYRADPTLIFDIWSGGFVWYGGALLSAVSGMIFLRLKKENLLPWLDLFAPVGALGYAIGRMACFFAGCCYGRVCDAPEILGGGYLRHPAQAYAVIMELIVLAVLVRLEKLKTPRPAGQIFFVWLALHGVSRIVMESFRADDRGPEPYGVSIATWISFVLIAVSLATIFVTSRNQRHIPRA